MTDPYYTYRPLLDLIGKAEGTDRGRGYNETLAYGAYTGGPVELTYMTLTQVDDLQTRMLAHPDNTWNSSAIGRYQIVRTTRREIEKVLGLSRLELFNETMQDRMACFLLGKRGIDKYLAGKLSEEAMINALAKEWASLPTTESKSFYHNQRASVTVDEVRRVLALVRSRSTPEKETIMNWQSIQQVLRIILYTGGGMLFGEGFMDGELAQSAIGGVLSIGAFIWWMVWEKGRKPDLTP